MKEDFPLEYIAFDITGSRDASSVSPVFFKYIYTYLYAYMYIYVHKCMYIHIYIYTYTYKYTPGFVHMISFCTYD
jgi:hypothetical protein